MGEVREAILFKRKTEKLIEMLILGGKTRIVPRTMQSNSQKLVNSMKFKICLKVVFHLCAWFTYQVFTVRAHADHAITILKENSFHPKTPHFALFARLKFFFSNEKCRLNLSFSYYASS